MLIDLRAGLAMPPACGNLDSNNRRMQQKSDIWPNLLQAAFNVPFHTASTDISCDNLRTAVPIIALYLPVSAWMERKSIAKRSSAQRSVMAAATVVTVVFLALCLHPCPQRWEA